MDRYGGTALGVECAWPRPGMAAAKWAAKSRSGFFARLLAGLARLG